MNLGKKVLVLVFLLVILAGVFVIQSEDLGRGYFSWLKAKMIGMGPELNLTEKDSGLDFAIIEPIIEEVEVIKEISTPIEIKKVKKVKEVKDEELIGIGGPIPGTEEKMSLAEIEAEVIRIQIEVERITIEIQNLTNSNL
ncbi:hypothetical protein KKA24_01570 [Patescibacteria group bacterium]|nr:hypothetical protein [Patescibacteria group bacterium]